MKLLLNFVLRSVTRHWRYSVGAFLSVAAGFLTLTLFRAYMADVERLYSENYETRSMYGHIIVEKEAPRLGLQDDPWTNVLGETDQTYLRTYFYHSNQVEHSVRFLTGSGIVSNTTVQSIFWAKGYDINEGSQLRGVWQWDTLAGQPLSLEKNPETIVLGKTLSRTMGCKIPDAELYDKHGRYTPKVRSFDCPNNQLQLSVTTSNGQLNALDGTLVGIVNGIFREIDNKFVMLPLPLMQRLFDTKVVSYYAVKLKTRNAINRFITDLKADSEKNGVHLNVRRWQDHSDADMYVRTMELLSVFRNFVVSILMAITGLSIFNTFLKIVNERTREIGTLRSLGFTRTWITQLFAVEALTLSMAGVGFGILTGLLITWLINAISIFYKAGMLSEAVPFRIAYDASVFVTSGVFLLVLSVVASLLAVISTVHRPITTNLVHV